MMEQAFTLSEVDDRIRLGQCPRFISDQQFPEAA